MPVRMVRMPGLYGYVSTTKSVTNLEVTVAASISAAACWTTRGLIPTAPPDRSSSRASIIPEKEQGLKAR